MFEFANRAISISSHGRDVLGKAIREALPELEGQGIYELLDGGLSVRGAVRRPLGAVTLQRRDGSREETFFDFVYQPLFDDGDQVTGIAVVAFDVTELTRARREAEAANRAKDEFLAMLGHELRNPLAPIVTALQLMRLRDVPGAERERTIIERQVKHVVSLVDDLLDVSRITRGQVQLKRERVDLADVVAKALEMTAPAIEERRHVLSVDVPRGLIVNGDAARLAQVIANLLTNAAKYTDPGGTIVGHRGRPTSMSSSSVADTRARHRAPRCCRASSTCSRRSGRRSTAARAGSDSGSPSSRASSTRTAAPSRRTATARGAGREFTIRLPLDAACDDVRANSGGARDAAPPAGAGSWWSTTMRTRGAAGGCRCEALGHVTRVATRAPARCEAVADFDPDVVLLDLGLPVMDGFEVARRMRALPGRRRRRTGRHHRLRPRDRPPAHARRRLRPAHGEARRPGRLGRMAAGRIAAARRFQAFLIAPPSSLRQDATRTQAGILFFSGPRFRHESGHAIFPDHPWVDGVPVCLRSADAHRHRRARRMVRLHRWP